MWSKDFDGWNALQKRLEKRQELGHFRAREVWWCSIGVNTGDEMDGHNEWYERPVLVLKGFGTQVFWGVLLSSKIKPGNPYYFTYRHDGVEYSAVVTQLRLLDAKRLLRKIFTMPPASFQQIQLRIIQEMSNAE